LYFLRQPTLSGQRKWPPHSYRARVRSVGGEGST
jgi:hypothetical protein